MSTLSGFFHRDSGGLPVPGLAFLFEPFEGTAHELALEGADVVDEELAVQVVDFVLQGTGEEALGRDGDRFTFGVKSLDVDAGVAFDVAVEAGKAQAALLADHGAGGGGDLGVDQGDGGIFVIDNQSYPFALFCHFSALPADQVDSLTFSTLSVTDSTPH